MSNLLLLPLKQTLPLSLSIPLASYISHHYDASPKTFDIASIQSSRDAILNISAHPGKLQSLLKYHAYIREMTSKFPRDMDIEFSWRQSLSHDLCTPLVQNDLEFERANVIFAIALVYSHLGALENRATHEGLKRSAAYFQNAAGCFHVLLQSPQVSSEEMHPDSLTMLENCMLAQASESVWQKAILDSLKDSTIARLSIAVSEFYSIAYTHALKSKACSTDIIHHLHLKSQHFYSASQFRLAQTHLSNSQYGFEVSRLKEALKSAAKALETARAGQKPVVEDLRGLHETVKRTLERAERDNDLIYLCPVPNIRDLPPVASAVTVKSTPPQLDHATDIFSRLLPWNVLKAVQVYKDRRDILVRDRIASWKHLSLLANKKLQELDLPGSLQAAELPAGLPPLLLSRATQVQEAGGVNRLEEVMQSIDRARSEDIEMWSEATELLVDADTEEKALLVAKSAEYREMLESAGDSDMVVRNRVTKWENLISILGGDLSDLEEFVPSAKPSKPSYETEKAIRWVRDSLDELSRLESKRRLDIEKLKRRVEADDIMPDILTEFQKCGPEVDTAHFEDLITARLTRYHHQTQNDPLEALLEKITAANDNFIKCRQSDHVSSRQKALQSLENAFLQFQQLLSDLDQGLVFYTSFAKPLTVFCDEVRKVCVKNPGTWTPGTPIKFAEKGVFDPNKHEIRFR